MDLPLVMGSLQVMSPANDKGLFVYPTLLLVLEKVMRSIKKRSSSWKHDCVQHISQHLQTRLLDYFAHLQVDTLVSRNKLWKVYWIPSNQIFIILSTSGNFGSAEWEAKAVTICFHVCFSCKFIFICVKNHSPSVAQTSWVEIWWINYMFRTSSLL